MTLTAKTIRAMTDTQAQQELDALAVAYFGNTRWKTLFADLIGYDSQSVRQWFLDGRRPPPFALILLDTLNQNREISIALRSVKSALDLAEELPETA